MSSLFSAPKVAPLPPEPKEESIAAAGRREKRKLQRGQVDTILTSGQGVAPSNQNKRTLLGGN